MFSIRDRVLQMNISIRKEGGKVQFKRKEKEDGRKKIKKAANVKRMEMSKLRLHRCQLIIEYKQDSWIQKENQLMNRYFKRQFDPGMFKPEDFSKWKFS